MDDQIRYDLLTQQALRGVVRDVLAEAAKKGLPGEHHFYIAFDTRTDGVRMPERLRTQYPEQMTIILQHQFWDLKVSETEFEVSLSFGGVPAKLTVPFEAINGFFDPSVQFGLQFEEVSEDGGDKMAPANAPKAQTKTSERKKRLPASSAPVPGLPAAEPTAEEPPASAPGPAASKRSGGGAEVVPLDRFRKK